MISKYLNINTINRGINNSQQINTHFNRNTLSTDQFKFKKTSMFSPHNKSLNPKSIIILALIIQLIQKINNIDDGGKTSGPSESGELPLEVSSNYLEANYTNANIFDRDGNATISIGDSLFSEDTQGNIHEKVIDQALADTLNNLNN